ncbi:MAG: hypothetical protein Crog4KO_33410 [Crocinitomicaceae bacterium]
MNGYSQIMINGGFEDHDYDDDGDGLDDDWYIYSIEYAVGWHNVSLAGSNPPNYANSCDIIHPFSIANGTPRTGAGCGGFGAVGNGNNEFCYGTTTPLVAGQEYSVSFWIRAEVSTSDDPIIGAVISQTIPTLSWQPQSINLSPQVTINDIGETYKEVKYCFTAQNNGVHYMTIGAFLGYGGMSNVYYFIDDVSITPITQGSPLPIAGLTIPQNTYCTSDVVLVDGNSSQNETGYTWEIYELTQGDEILQYSSGPQTGQAGTFDVSAVLGSVSEGECYRIYLMVDGVCPNETYVDYCYVDPEIDFIYDGAPVCENTPVNLTVTGEDGWTYTWSSGQSGTGTAGFKTVTVTPSVGNETFTVDVTTPEGCTFSKSITLTVHSQNNLAPWMDGVNGTGDYTFYMSSDQYYPSYSFTSNIYNDNSNEDLIYSLGNTNIPSQTTYVINLPQDDTPGGQMNFVMQTGGLYTYETPPGNYYFTVLVTDKNACLSLTSEIVFNLVVGCDHCPLCVGYEDRTPQGTPLPPLTESIDCITAGLVNNVETGNSNIIFQAGNTIDLGNFFSAGSGFQALIENTTCLLGCEDCCSNWTGFTLDEIPQVTIINTLDTDPTNDFWDVTDILNPYCAYGAQEFELQIKSPTGNVIHQEIGLGDCCAFQSRSPDNPIPHSSIWWNGAYGYDSNGNPLFSSETFSYRLVLRACDGQELVKQGLIDVNNPVLGGRMMEDSSEMLSSDIEIAEKWNRVQQEFALAPNPANDLLRIIGGEGNLKYQLFDQKGTMLSKIETLSYDRSIDISGLSPGKYFVRIYLDGRYALKEFVKL